MLAVWGIAVPVVVGFKGFVGSPSLTEINGCCSSHKHRTMKELAPNPDIEVTLSVPIKTMQQI
jgi:hypothetical protein